MKQLKKTAIMESLLYTLEKAQEVILQSVCQFIWYEKHTYKNKEGLKT